MQGVVKWFDGSKGFGFVIAGDKEVFVHYSQIRVDGFKTLNEGESVSFVMKEGPKGYFAEDVVKSTDGI